MRPPLLADVVAAARSLLAVAAIDRPALLTLLLAEADTAERFHRASGRTHPWFGDGSLMAAALRRDPVREPSLEDADYCRCLSAVLSRLAERAGSRPVQAARARDG